jgi:hypothetical protein
MKTNLTKKTALGAFALLAFALAASGDTLLMRDGRSLQGRFTGGTRGTILMEIDGVVRSYKVADAQYLSLDAAASAAAAPVAVPLGTGILMRDGRVIEGNYAGGTHSTILMDVNGEVQSFNAAEAQSLSFGGNTAPASANPSAAGQVTVPAGTQLLVRMIDGVDSSKNRAGDRFRASLEANLESGGVIIAPRGSDVYVQLTDARGAGHLSGHAELKLEVTGILINNTVVPIVTGEYEVAGKGRGGNTAKKAAGGAVVGAIIGALAGGGKGAAIGAGVGAGAGATVNIITKGEQVRVPSETMLEFRLDAPLTTVPAASASH